MEPWGEGTPWKNSTAFFTYLRGCLRKAWSRHPTRIAVVNKKRRQIDNPGSGYRKTVWGFDCEMCGTTKVIKEAQVDHIVPAGSLNQTSDIQGFVERLLYITEKDLRLVCKRCNMTLAYAERYGLSFEDAAATKQAIEFEKKGVKKVVDLLTKAGYNVPSNKDKRREMLVEHFKQENSK